MSGSSFLQQIYDEVFKESRHRIPLTSLGVGPSILYFWNVKKLDELRDEPIPGLTELFNYHACDALGNLMLDAVAQLAESKSSAKRQLDSAKITVEKRCPNSSIMVNLVDLFYGYCLGYPIDGIHEFERQFWNFWRAPKVGRSSDCFACSAASPLALLKNRTPKSAFDVATIAATDAGVTCKTQYNLLSKETREHLASRAVDDPAVSFSDVSAITESFSIELIEAMATSFVKEARIMLEALSSVASTRGLLSTLEASLRAMAAATLIDSYTAGDLKFNLTKDDDIGVIVSIPGGAIDQLLDITRKLPAETKVKLRSKVTGETRTFADGKSLVEALLGAHSDNSASVRAAVQSWYNETFELGLTSVASRANICQEFFDNWFATLLLAADSLTTCLKVDAAGDLIVQDAELDKLAPQLIPTSVKRALKKTHAIHIQEYLDAIFGKDKGQKQPVYALWLQGGGDPRLPFTLALLIAHSSTAASFFEGRASLRVALRTAKEGETQLAAIQIAALLNGPDYLEASDSLWWSTTSKDLKTALAEVLSRSLYEQQSEGGSKWRIGTEFDKTLFDALLTVSTFAEVIRLADAYPVSALHYFVYLRNVHSSVRADATALFCRIVKAVDGLNSERLISAMHTMEHDHDFDVSFFTIPSFYRYLALIEFWLAGGYVLNLCSAVLDIWLAEKTPYPRLPASWLCAVPVLAPGTRVSGSFAWFNDTKALKGLVDLAENERQLLGVDSNCIELVPFGASAETLVTIGDGSYELNALRTIGHAYDVSRWTQSGKEGGSALTPFPALDAAVMSQPMEAFPIVPYDIKPDHVRYEPLDLNNPMEWRDDQSATALGCNLLTSFALLFSKVFNSTKGVKNG